MEIIHLLVSLSLSGISHQHRPYRHTLDNSHQALCVYQLCPAFLLKEAVPGLPVTHIWWISTADQGVTSLPFFISPSVLGLGKSV